MQNNNAINAIQADILRQLFQKDGLRFAQINVENVPSDQFSYHLRQLVKYGLIEKLDDNSYRLSARGRTRTIMLYPNEDGFIEQGFLAVRLVISKQQDGKRYFLIQQRAKVPYKGTYATPGDKILFGEDVHDAARRILKAHTGLTCDLRLRGIRHMKDDYLGDIVQDKYFFVFSGAEPTGELLPESRTGHYLWLTYDEIKDSGLSIHGGLTILDIAESDSLIFSEETLTVETY